MTTPNYTTLTVIGGVCGVFGQDVGRWLKGFSLRDQDGRPTEQAIRDRFVKERLSEFGGSSCCGTRGRSANSWTACATSVAVSEPKWSNMTG